MVYCRGLPGDFEDWEASGAASITLQVMAFSTLVLGIYILTITREAAPGCKAGFRAVIGRDRPESSLAAQYQLCDVEEPSEKSEVKLGTPAAE